VRQLKRQLSQRRAFFIVALAVLALGLGQVPGSSQTNAAPARPDFSKFKLITERNIFDPHRSRRSTPGERQRVARFDYVTLVGTISYEKGPFAFFEGNNSEYRKVLPVSGVIAGYKVTDIQPGYVKLASATNQLELPVGSQLRRSSGEEEWQVAAAEAAPDNSNAGPVVRTVYQTVVQAEPSGTNVDSQVQANDPNSQPPAMDPNDSGSTNAGPETAGSDLPTDPVLRRLALRRQQENNR